MDTELIWDLLDAAREGEAAPIEQFFASHPAEAFLSVRNEHSLATPVHMASANGHADILRLILTKLGPELAKQAVDARNDAGNTPLLWASLTGSLECVELLVEAGADIAARNDAGVDAIAQSVRAGHDNVADFLYAKVEDSEEPVEDGEPVEQQQEANEEQEDEMVE